MQISPDLIELKHIRQSDAQRWGNKASMQGELLARGFPIPQGICLSIAAFRQVGADLVISPQLEAALIAASKPFFLEAGSLAVRSSAAAEDLSGASYAGLYQSMIGVSEPGGMATAVQSVWRSYTDPLAAAARQAHLQDDSAGGMGVLIQPVIKSEVAGVCFSLDPVKPLSGRLVINACWGLGPGIMDGSIPADTLWLRRRDLALVEQRIVEKDACYTLHPQAGLVRSRVSGPRRRARCLPENWATRIAQFAMAAEQVFACPQDVEWAIADGKVWILQSRPIASLDSQEAVKNRYIPIEWQSPEDFRRLWTRSSFECQGIDPLLPLDIDYIRLLENTRLETCLFLGADRNQELRVFHGQIYTSPAEVPLGQADLRLRQQAFQDLELRLLSEGRTAWDYWGPEIERANERLGGVDTSLQDGSGLADFLEQAMAARSRHNILHPILWFKPSQSYFDAFRAVSGLSGMEADTAAYQLLEGEESPLTRLIDGLYRLAEEARTLPPVADWMRWVTNHPEAQNANELLGFPNTAPGASGWFSHFQAFLTEFGDRNGSGYGSEALLTTPTWRDHPIQAVSLVAQFVASNMVSPSRQRQQSRKVIDAQIDALCKHCPDPQMVEAFLQQLRMARRVQPVVEIHNHHIEQVGLGQLRRAVLAASSWLHSVGLLAEVDDVFWLTFSEILASLLKTVREPLSDIINARKREYQKSALYEPPPYLGLPPAELSPGPLGMDALTPDVPQPAGQIRGIGASAGVASGFARVIDTWQPAPRVQPGNILVAENAGPLWLPFFPILAGIVLEGGSLGQHAASTAREYGLPAVISAPNATRVIKDGDWVTIDGVNGVVELDLKAKE